MPPRPTTSTYALLGLLALRPWSAYELAQQATRSLRYTHPRTESHLYEEAKRLLGLGWATTRTEHCGRRKRSIYEITDDGRRALQGWFATAPRDPQLEFEALLRLLFADQTDTATVDRWLEETGARARQLLDEGIERLLRPYVTDEGSPFPERRHIAALVAAFVVDYLRLIEGWSEFARNEIRAWPRTDGLGMTDRTREILETVLEGESVLDPNRASSTASRARRARSGGDGKPRGRSRRRARAASAPPGPSGDEGRCAPRKSEAWHHDRGCLHARKPGARARAIVPAEHVEEALEGLFPGFADRSLTRRCADWTRGMVASGAHSPNGERRRWIVCSATAIRFDSATCCSPRSTRPVTPPERRHGRRRSSSAARRLSSSFRMAPGSIRATASRSAHLIPASSTTIGALSTPGRCSSRTSGSRTTPSTSEWKRSASAASEGAAAWVDPEGYRRFVAAKRRAFEDEVDTEKAAEPGGR